MPNLILSPTLLIGLLLAIIGLLVLIAYLIGGARRRLDIIARQQQDMIAVLASGRERAREIEPTQPSSLRSRAEPRLADVEGEEERPSHSRSAADLVARR